MYTEPFEYLSFIGDNILGILLFTRTLMDNILMASLVNNTSTDYKHNLKQKNVYEN